MVESLHTLFHRERQSRQMSKGDNCVFGKISNIVAKVANMFSNESTCILYVSLGVCVCVCAEYTNLPSRPQVYQNKHSETN